MGAWGDGPFDNDSALDWCGTLQDADRADRVKLVRSALATVADSTGYLDFDEAAEGVAAAAIVASLVPGGSPVNPADAPAFLAERGAMDLADDLPSLAVAALARVVGEDSEWRELWSQSGATDFPKLQRLRAVLAGS